MAHKTYAPKDVTVAWNNIAITGFAEDSFLRLEWAEDIVSEKVGSDGTLALTKSANQTGSVEIELMATAKSNIFLGAIEKAQRLQTASIAFSNFEISDPSGNALAVAKNAYLKTRPSIDLGSDQNSKVWVFGCEYLEFVDVPAELAGEIDSALDALTFS